MQTLYGTTVTECRQYNEADEHFFDNVQGRREESEEGEKTAQLVSHPPRIVPQAEGSVVPQAAVGGLDASPRGEPRGRSLICKTY